jgi:L-ascorbate metabolism protein UlaG (beta-lactamase superfamily)
LKRLALVALAGIAGCTMTFKYFDPEIPHRASAQGFRNNYPHPERGAGFWRWKWEQWRAGLPPTPEGGYRFEIAAPQEPHQDPRRGEPSVTWVGHATLLLHVGGRSILTDPQFSERASPVRLVGPRRVVPPVPALEQLPHIDAVLISHNHYDHLDRDSVAKLAAQAGGPPRYFVPLGLKDWFARLGIDNVVELDWWQKVDYEGLELHFVPVQHWSKRTLLDTNLSLWGGWVVLHPQLSFFFAGDTGYSKDFADIRAKFGGFDLAAIPIGAYAPRWFMHVQHVDPAEAIRVHRDVNARQSVGIHWGTFAGLTDESLYEPPLALAAERKKAGIADEDFFVMKHGETRVLTSQASLRR